MVPLEWSLYSWCSSQSTWPQDHCYCSYSSPRDLELIARVSVTRYNVHTLYIHVIHLCATLYVYTACTHVLYMYMYIVCIYTYALDEDAYHINIIGGNRKLWWALSLGNQSSERIDEFTFGDLHVCVWYDLWTFSAGTSVCSYRGYAIASYDVHVHVNTLYRQTLNSVIFRQIGKNLKNKSFPLILHQCIWCIVWTVHYTVLRCGDDGVDKFYQHWGICTCTCTMYNHAYSCTLYMCVCKISVCVCVCVLCVCVCVILCPVTYTRTTLFTETYPWPPSSYNTTELSRLDQVCVHVCIHMYNVHACTCIYMHCWWAGATQPVVAKGSWVAQQNRIVVINATNIGTLEYSPVRP